MRMGRAKLQPRGAKKASFDPANTIYKTVIEAKLKLFRKINCKREQKERVKVNRLFIL